MPFFYYLLVCLFLLLMFVETLLEVLKQDVDVARNFKPMPEEEKVTLLSRIRDEASDGRHELFKSTKAFDGLHHRKQHGFELGSA